MRGLLTTPEKKNAASVMAIETGLTKNAVDAADQRDPEKIYHLAQ